VTAPPADGSSPPDIPLLDGRYAIGEAIGRGRSTVHRAEDRRLRRQVAIKEVRLAEGQEGAERARLRALREAQAAARLDNPGVVTVYDVVEEGGSIWLVMELVDAPSLAQLVADDGPLDHGRAARIGLGVLGALEAAHAVGVVHRDVKPANVLVGRDDRTKLADFGVATIRDESRVTATGTIVGSPSYMAPEQAMAAEVGPFTDLWALGATLYYAVEGKPPFAGDSPLATASAVVHGEPRPPQSRGPLIGLLQRLLDKDPQRRPGARQVRATLVAAATTGPSRGARAGRGRDHDGGGNRDRGRGAGGPATPFGRRDPTLIARPSSVRDTRQVIIPPAGQPPAPAPPATEDAPSAGEAAVAAGGAASVPAGASTPAGGTEAVGAGGDAIPPTRAEQAVDDADADDEGAEGAEGSVADAEPASSPSGDGDGDGGGDVAHPSDDEKSAAPAPAPAPALASLAGPSRVGDGVLARRSPAVVVAAVVAVVALIVVAAWAAAGDGGGGDGSETDGGRDASSTTTAADEEASQTTATTAASTTTTTAADGGVPEGWTRYRGPNGVYTIAHPAGWQVQPADGPRVRIRDPETGSYLLIDWTDEPRSDPVADWRAQAQGFAERHEAYREIRIERFDYRNYNAAIWEFRYRDEGVDLHVANLGFVARNRGYALYFQTHEDRWAGSQGTFDRLRESFRPG
jgi:eukaryotic-like serine/threonine-protein kinase